MDPDLNLLMLVLVGDQLVRVAVRVVDGANSKYEEAARYCLEDDCQEVLQELLPSFAQGKILEAHDIFHITLITRNIDNKGTA